MRPKNATRPRIYRKMRLKGALWNTRKWVGRTQVARALQMRRAASATGSSRFDRRDTQDGLRLWRRIPRARRQGRPRFNSGERLGLSARAFAWWWQRRVKDGAESYSGWLTDDGGVERVTGGVAVCHSTKASRDALVSRSADFILPKPTRLFLKCEILYRR